MKRNLLYMALLLLAAQGAWARETNYYPVLINPAPTEGPWTFEAVNSRAIRYDEDYDDFKYYKDYYSFNELDHTAWSKRSHDGHPIIYQWQDKDGLGFSWCSSMPFSTTFGIFSTYYHDEKLPPYTRRKLTWKFKIRSMQDDSYGMNSCLYALPDLDALKNLQVRWYYYYDYKEEDKGPYCIGYKGNTDVFWSTKKTRTSDPTTATFEFDNRYGSDTIVKSWYILKTMVSGGYDKTSTHEWSSFIHLSESWDTYYYKYISFDGNDGKGIMPRYDIENSGTLPANTFTREGYTFAGWATSPNGEKVYNDKAAVTATEDSKGPVTLYAVWKAQPASVVALISAIGTVEYTAGCNARILAARAAYDALSEEEQALVSNYATLTAAETLYAAVDTVVKKIAAIGEVTYPGSAEAIAQANAAYDALTAEAKALVINYSQLSAAQEMYAVLAVIVQINAIGEVTTGSKDLIVAARTAYDALTLAPKTQVSNYATLLAAEAAYANLGKTVVLFEDKDAAELKSESKAIVYPELPEGATQWKTREKDASDKTIVIQAVEGNMTTTPKIDK